MKQINSIRLVTLALVALFAIAQQTWAQSTATITLDELGNGTITTGISFPTAGQLLADPGPGGLSSALTYNLLGPPGLVAGDLIILEPGLTTVSDIVRFNPQGTGGNNAYPASVVFYSDNLDGADALADTGFPTALYINNTATIEVGPEDNNGVFYTPTATQPGFITGFVTTYHFISDVPEPSVGMFVIAAIAISAARRRQRIS
jgi:hypothetical protein